MVLYLLGACSRGRLCFSTTERVQGIRIAGVSTLNRYQPSMTLAMIFLFRPGSISQIVGHASSSFVTRRDIVLFIPSNAASRGGPFVQFLSGTYLLGTLTASAPHRDRHRGGFLSFAPLRVQQSSSQIIIESSASTYGILRLYTLLFCCFCCFYCFLFPLMLRLSWILSAGVLARMLDVACLLHFLRVTVPKFFSAILEVKTDPFSGGSTSFASNCASSDVFQPSNVKAM